MGSLLASRHLTTAEARTSCSGSDSTNLSPPWRTLIRNITRSADEYFDAPVTAASFVCAHEGFFEGKQIEVSGPD
jgi:hypothetical protein